MVGLGYFEGVLMDSDTVLMMLIALNFGFMAFILMKLDAKKEDKNRLELKIEKALASITMPDLNFDDLKNDLLEMVEELMANMRIPSIADHLGGALSGFMQMKQMKMAQDLGLHQPPQNEEYPPDSD
tara:strand:- start:813 stop:1193 length:381 start_codon:yes stop_codon:yes gene_type:complete